jgi:hypothetical protein
VSARAETVLVTPIQLRRALVNSSMAMLGIAFVSARRCEGPIAAKRKTGRMPRFS